MTGILAVVLFFASIFGALGNNGYTCEISNSGKRIDEGSSFDCRSTCKGGQCVAYVKCKCTRSGKYPPQTQCWRPGTKLTTTDGKCNKAVPQNTAIATFNGQRYGVPGRPNGHAAVFAGCANDYTIKVYDQWCGRSIGYSHYGTASAFYKYFAVVTNPGICEDSFYGSHCNVRNSGRGC